MRRLPITIVSGFLGAGKTTILSNLIKSVGESRLVVLVNEFGSVSIDELILERKSGTKSVEFIGITNALVAYTGDHKFDECMAALRDRTDVDHVLIETSGLAVPSAIIERILQPTFRENFVLDAALLVIDTPNLLKGFEAPLAEVFTSQLLCSDVAILNKIDDLNDHDFLKAESIIRGLSPNLRFIELARQAKVNPAVALGLHLNEPTYGDVSSRVPGVSKAPLGRQDGHEHSGLGPHEHGLLTHQHIHEHDPSWISFVLRTNELQDRDELVDALQDICESEQVFRVKGSAFVSGVREKILFQAVGSRVSAGSFEMGEHHERELVYDHEHSPTSLRDHSHGHTHDRAHDQGYIQVHSHGHPHDHDHSHGHVHEHDHAHSHKEGVDTHGELVIIGYGIDRKQICTRLEECTHTAWY
jgi:cobalamin biosynthesis protein CobW